jgi:hypothetical protein
MLIESEDQWWGFNASNGWMVVDWTDPSNRPGYEAVRKLYMIRCRDWHEVSIRWSDWSTPGYVSAKDRLVASGSMAQQSGEAAELQQAQDAFYRVNARLCALREMQKDFISFSTAKRFFDLCATLKLDALHHLTHLDNLPGIIAEGVVCHRRARPAKDISNAEIQQHRADKLIPGSPAMTLHDCVPLFVAPRPPMLSALRNAQAEIAYLQVKPGVMLRPKVVFTDGNARSNTTSFFSAMDDLRRLDWALLRARYWNHEDPEQHRENKRRRSAEVLVPDCVPRGYIERIAVMTEPMKKLVEGILHDSGFEIPVVLDPDLYYPPSAKPASGDNVGFGNVGDEIPF